MTDNRRQTTDLRPKTEIERRMMNGKAGIPWRITSHEPRATSKAFTIIELLTAVGLMALVISFAGLIFKVSIEGQRTASANAEIMGKLRAVTDQLNADFKGALWSPNGRVRFQYITDPNVRSDCIVFFANGDFQSTGQYGPSGSEKTVVGSVASIFYGLADTAASNPKEKILVRRQTIITSDTSMDILDFDPVGEYYNEKSLAELIAEQNASPDGNIPEMAYLITRPDLDPDNLSEEDVAMYMAKGVDNFTIQYVGTDYDDLGNPLLGIEFNDWRPDANDIKGNIDQWNNRYFTPLAFKFTFTLYDSRGVLQGGRRFTHIVYLGN